MKKAATSKRIDWWKPVMGTREKELVCEVIESHFPNDGEYTAAFERRIADLCGVPYAVAVTSGTAAIFLGLVAGGVGRDDEVLVPDITFVATANAVTLAGAKPVLVDVDRDDFCMDPASAEAAITPRTKAILPVHVSGRAAPMPALQEIARKHGLRVVEDAAAALGSRAYGSALGTFGDVGCFSFTATKTITTGQGGMVVTKDPALHQRLRELKDQGRPVRGTGGADDHLSVGYNFKLTNLQAAMGLAQLEDLPARLEHLRRLYTVYREALAKTPRIRVLDFDLEAGECPQWIDAIVDDRDSLHDFLLAHDVCTRKYWYPVHRQPPYKAGDESFVNSTRASYRSLWLPSALTLTSDDVHYVCELIDSWARSG
jgi:perosamine synthetase